MFVRTVTVAKISLTREDLTLLAWSVLKTGDPNRKIEAIKKLREMVRDVTPVDAMGEPLTAWNDSLQEWEVVHTYGLKECKEALDHWYSEREFIG